MQTSLLQFITTLRKHDIPVSTAETLDAMQVAAVVGYRDRDLLKQGLAGALAKTVEDKTRFYECFEQFYGDQPAASSPAADKEAETPPGDFDLPADIAADAAVSAAMEAPLVRILTGDSPQAITVATQEAAASAGLDNLQFNTQKGIFRRRIMDALGAEGLDKAIEALRAIEREDADRAAEWLEQRRHELDLQAREMVDHQLLLNANAAGRDIQQQALRQVRLSALEQYHLRQMPVLIRQLAKKLAARHRRRRRVDRRGKLDIGKTLRRNIAYGGVPFHTYWKKKRKDQPRVLVLCDVSGSVATYARFLLLFLYSLNEVMPRIRSFVFSNRLAEVTDLFDRHPAEKAIEIANQRWGQGSSDYGTSFAMFGEQCLQQIDSNTTVIVLGDGRCNHGETGLDVLRDVYHRAKLVLWFNPEPRSHWNTGDSEIRRYQTACHYVAECNSLAKLERLLDRLLTLVR